MVVQVIGVLQLIDLSSLHKGEDFVSGIKEEVSCWYAWNV